MRGALSSSALANGGDDAITRPADARQRGILMMSGAHLMVKI
jgi:hypothetical protein